MGIQIGARPDSGFDDPLGMLKDCHRRIESFLRVLCTVAERAHGQPMTLEESDAVQSALSYFRTGGQRHTADEEESLFPRLRKAGASAEISELEDDHREASELHGEVETIYRRWMADAELLERDAESLKVATERLRELYDAHIRVEDEVVFPKAAQVLDKGAIRAIGEEFRARRV